MDLNNLSTQLKKLTNHFIAEKFDFVITNGKVLLAKYPFSSYLQNLIGSSYQKIGDLKNAEICFQKAIKLETNNIAAINNLGNVYKSLHEYSKAEELYKRALSKNQKNISALVNYGNLKIELFKYEEGINFLKKALEIDDKNIFTNYNIGMAYLDLGENSLANKHFMKVLQVNENFTYADQKISTYTDYNKNKEHLLKMKDKIEKKLKKNEKVFLHFALGKAYEDIKDYKESINNINEGNKLKSENISYNINDELLFIDNIINNLKNIDFNKIKIKSNEDKKYVFVVGMPRSGTSLVEQILSSHSNVLGVGELPFLRKLIIKNFNFDEKKSIDLSNNTNLLKEISTNYEKYTNFFENKKKYLLDKSPLNFMWIGFIKILFPYSKIIYINRKPLDVCMSCYKNIFESSLNWSYNLENIANFYKKHVKLMDFWKQKKIDFFEINYENLINNFEYELNKVLKYCELSFEESCLNFYKSKSPVKTVSINQVRKPIYKTSIDKYKFYKEEIEIISNILK